MDGARDFVKSYKRKTTSNRKEMESGWKECVE